MRPAYWPYDQGELHHMRRWMYIVVQSLRVVRANMMKQEFKTVTTWINTNQACY